MLQMNFDLLITIGRYGIRHQPKDTDTYVQLNWHFLIYVIF